MSLKKPHFSYAPLGGQLDWIRSGEHEYELKPVKGRLGLTATANGKLLGAATTLDHFIWDEIVKKKNSTRCDSLTIWTKDIEFNLLLFGGVHSPHQLRCAYFATPESDMCREHLAYWGVTIGSKRGGVKAHPEVPAKFLRVAINRAVAAIGTKKRPKIQRVISKDDAERVKKLLPQIVVWNRYTSSVVKGTGTKFTRCHAFALDALRANLQTIPIPTAFLDKDKSLRHISGDEEAARSLYELVLSGYETVTGCGSPMQRNLLALASLLADPNIRVVLITGEPGTGKENLCKAIYYGDKLHQPAGELREAVFLQTTAGEIQAAMVNRVPKMPGKFLRERVAEEIYRVSKGWSSTARSPLIFIDELNKAEQVFLAAMLRPLEQGKSEINTEGDPKFVLAASQHIDELAKKPPQDFWTRVSHQLRVVHPLSRVSEEDGHAFLLSFFYSQWWSFIEVMVREYDTLHAESLVKTFLGEILGGKLEPSDLCKLVRDVFVNTLVPLVSRDVLSVRGARSILSQVFARLSWLVRFQKPTWGPKLDEDTKEDTNNEIARLVNSAVQDVMVILIAARATPAGLEDVDR